MILADSSAWIEFDRATGSPVHRRMLELAADPTSLWVTDPVRMEVLAGARSPSRRRELNRLFDQFGLLRCDSPGDFDAAAEVFARCREAGVTPRGLLDCLIAAIGWRSGAALLHHDVDLARIASVIGLDQDPASISPGRAQG